MTNMGNTSKFRNYFNIISGFAFKTDDLLDNGDIPVIKIGNISNREGIKIDENTQYVNSKFLSLDVKYHINKDDILISLTGSHINQPNSMVGRVCRNRENKEYLLNQRAGKVITKKGNADYIYYLLSTNEIKYAIANRAYGGANQVNISPKAILSIGWDFPDDMTQIKIGKILRKYDDLIENNKKRIDILDRMANLMFKEWFVKFRFPGYDTCQFITSNTIGWRYGVHEDTVNIPVGWKFDRLSEIAKFIRGKNITSAEMIAGDVPVISAGLEPSGYHNESNVKGFNLTISASGANAGYLAYHLEDVWAADCSYYNNQENIWFVYNTLKFLQPVLTNMQVGSAQPHVYPKNINRTYSIIPSPEILELYCKKVTPIYDEINVLTRKNKYLLEQRDILLPRLMSGKLSVEGKEVI